MKFNIKKYLFDFFSYKFFLYVSFAYVLFKSFFVNYGNYFTYFYVLYGGLCTIFFLIINHHIIRFKYKIPCFGICCATILSIVINMRFNIKNISLTSIIFINFIILSNCFLDLDRSEVKNTVFNIFYFLAIFSFFWAIIAITLCVKNISFDFFGVEFGLLKGSNRLQLLRPSVNPTGHFALCSIGCCIYCFLNSNNNSLKKYFYLVNVILLLIVIYFTNSIETIIAFVVSLMFSLIILFLLNKKIKHRYLYLIVFCVFVSIVLLFIVRFIDLNVFHFHTFLERIDIISASLYILRKSNIFFGSSFGGLIDDWGIYKDEVINNARFLTEYFHYVDFIKYAISTHNCYIHILISIGIVGFVFFSLYIINVLLDVFKVFLKVSYIDLIKLLPLFFIILSTLIIGLAADCIFTTMTELPNLLFFVATSALINIYI